MLVVNESVILGVNVISEDDLTKFFDNGEKMIKQTYFIISSLLYYFIIIYLHIM